MQGAPERSTQQPSSRVASSAYGGPTPHSPGRSISQTFSPPPTQSQPRTSDADLFRAPAPRAANGQLLQDLGQRPSPTIETRPLRYASGFSQQGQAPDSPSDLAPPLSVFRPIEPPRSPISPPPPSKSARRPTQSSANSTSRVMHDRLGMSSPASPALSSPVPELPTKSGARVMDSPRSMTGDRSEVPWKSPAKERQEYFQHQPDPKVPETEKFGPTTVKQREASGSSTIDEHQDTDFGEAAYFDEVLSNFKWTSTRGTKDLAYRLQDELAALEAANIHAIVESDERVSELMARLDHGIAQCDDMSNLLTIYEFELASVSDHIKNIEGQSQGLQVQTANQKALIAEIDNVLTNITISDSDLDVLKGRGGNLDSDEGVQAIERSLVNLYRALVSMKDETIDGQSMSAMKVKRKDYEQSSGAFLARLAQFLQIKYQAVLVSKQESSSKGPSRVLPGHEEGFMSLFVYSSFMLYAQRIDPKSHSDYMRRYAAASKSSWREIIVNFATNWKAFTRKSSVEENEMMFTAAKDLQSTSTARSATIKRTNTIAKQIRSVGRSSADPRVDDGKLPGSEVFKIILDNLALVIANEQNFLVSFFHLASSQAVDLPDYVASKPMLFISSLDEHRQTEPNRVYTKERFLLMESIFGWIYSELVNLVEALIALDPMQVVGILKSVEIVSTEWSDSDQEFLLRTLQKLNDRLLAIFKRFIADQVKAIQDIKVTSKKRGGIIPVFEIFPDFLERLEVQLQDDEGTQVPISQLEIRVIVNEAYEQLSKAMFDSVRTLASAGSINIQSSTDPEDKEALNYHILMVENMHQYLDALNSRDSHAILDDFKRRATINYKEHLTSYSRQIVLRPIGRLQDFTEGIERLQKVGENPASKSAYSQTSLKRLLSDHEERDMRKGIAAMWKRVDKHFGSSVSGGGAGNVGPADGSDETLLAEIWRAVQVEYLDVTERFTRAVGATYPTIQPDFGKGMIVAAFGKRDM